MKKLPKITQLRKPKGTKSYAWDNGCVAFGDPMEQSEKREKHLKREKERWQKTKKSKGDPNNCKNFHLKHG
jgi:hypothetical protein